MTSCLCAEALLNPAVVATSPSHLPTVYCMCAGGNEEEALLDFDAVQVTTHAA